MSFIARQPQKILSVNELPEYENFDSSAVKSSLISKGDGIFFTSAIKKNKVININEEYAHTQTQHPQLMGDYAAGDQFVKSTVNWNQTVRKQFAQHKFNKYYDNDELDSKIIIWNKIKAKYKHFIPVLEPNCEFLTYWKIPVLIITIFIFVEIPLIIFFSDAFYDTFRTPEYTFFRAQTILIYLIDIFIEFHVQFYIDGALVKNRYRVASNYFYGMFIYDLIPTIVLISTTFSYELATVYMFYLLFLLKLYPVYEIDQRFIDQLEIYPKWKTFYVIVRMIFELLYLAHFFGCMFFGTGIYMLKKAEEEGININSWLTFSAGNFGIIERYDWTKKYILSVYWAFDTLATLGYGDITPMNEFEIIVAIICMVAGVFLVSNNVANIQQTFVDYFDERRKYQREIIAIIKFMRYKQVSKETEIQITHYLQHYFKEKIHRDHYIEEQVIQRLATSLKSKLLFEAYQRYLYSVPWIISNFSEEFIVALSSEIQEIDLSEKENIFLDNDFKNQDDNSLYFVQVGHVEIFVDVQETKRQEVVLAHLKQGTHFGDYAFITGMKRMASARSKKYSQILKLKRAVFLEIIKKYPTDHERFCFLKDELIFQNAYYELGLQCYTCSNTDHMSIECPLTHLNIGNDVKRQCRVRQISQRQSRLIDSNLYIQDRIPFYRSLRKYKTQKKNFLNDNTQELYFYRTQDKIKYEAFYGNNQVIIESFQVDKIENFLNYYPNYNFDTLINKQQSLTFAQKIVQRQLSGALRKSEIKI